MPDNPDKWDEFRRRYFREVDARPDAWTPILSAARRGGAVTLIYSSHDTQRNNAVALRDYLLAHASRPRAAKRKAATRRASRSVPSPR
jgi:uncharacterized protein YeaO (DUF488 family)